MNEKLAAGIVTAAAIVQICALCVLGPAVIASTFAGALAWVGGASGLLTVVLTVATGLLVYRTLRRRHTSILNFSECRPTRLRPTVDGSKHAMNTVVAGSRSTQRGERS